MALKSFAGPRIILGTEKVTGVQCVGYIKQALAAGYRMFDTAQVYNNEEAISQAISSCNVPRNQIYVSTKIAKGFKKNPSTTRGAKESVHGSLQRFGLDYFDAVMIHHPGDDTTDPAASDCRLATWQALVELHEQRLVRNIGVSNFSVSHLRELLQCSRRFPSFNQVEVLEYAADS